MGAVCSVAYTTELLCSIVTICHSESSPNILVAVVRTLQLPFAKILAGLEIKAPEVQSFRHPSDGGRPNIEKCCSRQGCCLPSTNAGAAVCPRHHTPSSREDVRGWVRSISNQFQMSKVRTIPRLAGPRWPSVDSRLPACPGTGLPQGCHQFS